MAVTKVPLIADAETVPAFAAVLASTPDARIETQMIQSCSWCEDGATLFEAASTTASPTQVECEPDAPEEDRQQCSCSNSVSPVVAVSTPSEDHKCTLPKIQGDTSPAVSPKLWPLGGPEAEPSPVVSDLIAATPRPLTPEWLSALSSLPSSKRVHLSTVLLSSPRGKRLEANSIRRNEELQRASSHAFVADTNLDITFSKTPSLTQASRRRLSRSISPIARHKTQAEQVVATCSEGFGPQEAARPRAETEPRDVFLQLPRPSPRQVVVCPRSVSPIKYMPR